MSLRNNEVRLIPKSERKIHGQKNHTRENLRGEREKKKEIDEQGDEGEAEDEKEEER